MGATEFNQGLNGNFGDTATIDSERVQYTNEGTGDTQVFFGKEEESFLDKMLSPTLVMGVVCSMVGVVWLLFLRSNLDDSKYPSYKSAPPLFSGNNALEMVSPKSTDPLV